VQVEWPHDDDGAPKGAPPDLTNVGLVMWQSSFLLADFLLRNPPFGPSSWPALSVLEVGAGPGVVGMALALAGAKRVVMSDLPHITPLTRTNVVANVPPRPLAPSPHVVEHAWGEDVTPLLAACHNSGAGAAAPLGMAASSEGGQIVHPIPLEGHLPTSTVTSACGSENDGQCKAGLFDLIIGSDVLYLPDLHGALLQTLRACAAPHACVFLAFRRRGMGEEGFPEAAVNAGWAVEAAPLDALHDEFRGGEYSVLRLVWLG